jgi:16S rRNA (cytidine1402-2'-O)-methyltransferase
MGTLYLVSTPIGNLEDFSFRAKRLLSTVSFIACEDTRRTGSLLKKLAIKPPNLLSCYEGNELARLPQLLKLLKNAQDGALISNAGTPTISDPGYKLVRACLKNHIPVVPVPGASAVLTALVASGLPTDKFIFLGYLPEKPGKREKILKDFSFLPATVIFYVSPHHLLKTLHLIQTVLGDIDLVIANELTKLFEKFYRARVSHLITLFAKQLPRGEYVILFTGLQSSKVEVSPRDNPNSLAFNNRRTILPARFLGSASTYSISRG